MNSSPPPEMNARRTGPSGPASSATPGRGGGADGGRTEREEIAAGRAWRHRRREALVQPLDLERELRTALFDRALLDHRHARDRVIGRRSAREPRDERANDYDRRRPLGIHT